MHSFPFSCAARIERRTGRPGYGLLAGIVSKNDVRKVNKERGKERIPYPLFELTATDDSALLYGSPDYNNGTTVMAPVWSIVAMEAVSPQAAKPVAVTE